MVGRINSIQSLGALDGPGLRFVVFVQGCPLRCGCCHNPDTWELNGGTEISSSEIVAKASRFKEYFGKNGGITVSGGEPLCQAEFVSEIFTLCRKEGINTCLDTSGCILNDKVIELLNVTDRILLDIKYTTDELYRQYVGCEKGKVFEFLGCAEKMNIPVILRQVIIPTLNDNSSNINELKEIIKQYSCIDKAELLPFKKICQVKYDKMGIAFPFANIPEADKIKTAELEKLLNN